MDDGTGYKGEIYEREVDGKPGAVGVGRIEGRPAYYIRYAPDATKEGDHWISGVTGASIISMYDWDTTNKLIETIHIVKGS
jgi:hypothetical protein